MLKSGGVERSMPPLFLTSKRYMEDTAMRLKGERQHDIHLLNRRNGRATFHLCGLMEIAKIRHTVRRIFFYFHAPLDTHINNMRVRFAKLLDIVRKIICFGNFWRKFRFSALCVVIPMKPKGTKAKRRRNRDLIAIPYI